MEDAKRRLPDGDDEQRTFFLCQRVVKSVVDGWVHEYTVDSYLVPDAKLEKLGQNTAAMLRRRWSPSDDEDRANRLATRLFDLLAKGHCGAIHHRHHRAKAGPGPTVTCGPMLEANQLLTGTFITIS